MGRRYSVSAGNTTAIITDNKTGGVLTVRNVLNKEPGENDIDPIVEFTNDFNQSIRDRSLVLTLIGDQNEIVFDDDFPPVLEGMVELKNVQLRNPHLVNVNLINVNIPNCENLTISYSRVDDLSNQDTVKIHLSHCFVNNSYPVALSKTRREFLMNQNVTETMW